MKIRNKILLSLSVVLIALLLIAPASADVDIISGLQLVNFLNSTTETVGNINADFTVVPNGSALPAMNKTLNLNGHTLSGGGMLMGAPFILEDSNTVLTVNGSGTITSPSVQAFFEVNGGRLNLNNLTFDRCGACFVATNMNSPSVYVNGVTVNNPASLNGSFWKCYGNDGGVTLSMTNVNFTNVDVAEPLMYNDARRGNMMWNGGSVSGNFALDGCLIKNHFTSTELTIKNVDFEDITTQNPLNMGENTCDKYMFEECNFTNVKCYDCPMWSFQQTFGAGTTRGEFVSCTITNCSVDVSGTTEYPLIKWSNMDLMHIDDLAVDGFTSNSYGLLEFIGNSSSTSAVEISSLDCKNCTSEEEFTILKTKNIERCDIDLTEIHDSTIKVPVIVTSDTDTCAYGLAGCYFYNLDMDFAIPDYPAIMGFDANNANVVMDDVSIHDNDVVSGKSDTYYCLSIQNANANMNNVVIEDNHTVLGFGLDIGSCTHSSTFSDGITFTGNDAPANTYCYILHITNNTAIPINCNANTGYDYGLVVDNHVSNGLTLKNITLHSTNYGKNAIYIDSAQTEPNPTHLVTFTDCTFTDNTNNSATEPVLIWSGYGDGIGFSSCTISGNMSNDTTNKKVIELLHGDAVIKDDVTFASDTQTIYLHDNTYLQFIITATPATKVRILLENQTIGDRITDQGTRPSPLTANDMKVVSSIPYSFSFTYPNYYLDTPKTDIMILGGDVVGVGSVKCSETAITLTTVPSAEGLYFKGIYADATLTKKIAEPDGTLLPNVAGYTDGFGRWICTDATLNATGLFEPPPPTVWQKTLNASTGGMTAAMIIGALASLVLGGVMLFGIIRTGHVSLPLLIGMGACVLICFVIIIVAGNLDATGLDLFKPKGL